MVGVPSTSFTCCRVCPFFSFSTMSPVIISCSRLIPSCDEAATGGARRRAGFREEHACQKERSGLKVAAGPAVLRHLPAGLQGGAAGQVLQP